MLRKTITSERKEREERDANPNARSGVWPGKYQLWLLLGRSSLISSKFCSNGHLHWPLLDMSGWNGQNFLFAKEQQRVRLAALNQRNNMVFVLVPYFVHVLSLHERIGFTPAGTRAHARLLYSSLSCTADWLAGWI